MVVVALLSVDLVQSVDLVSVNLVVNCITSGGNVGCKTDTPLDTQYIQCTLDTAGGIFHIYVVE